MIELPQNPSPTELAVWRKTTGSKPHNRQDPYHLRLAIQGGSMRAVRTGGAVTALQRLGLKDSFDGTDSVSAGTCADAYWEADQTPIGTSIYYQDLTTYFLDKRRLLQNQPVMDLSFLIYDVMVNKKPLKAQRVVNSERQRNFYITSATDLAVVRFSDFKDPQDVLEGMFYSCLLPPWASLPIKVGHQYYTDGAYGVEDIPLDQAIAQGATHVLVLSSRARNTFKKLSLDDILTFLALRKAGFEVLAQRVLRGASISNQKLNRIYQMEQDSDSPVRVEMINVPEEVGNIKPFETRPQVLRTEAVHGFETTMAKFRSYNLPEDEDIGII